MPRFVKNGHAVETAVPSYAVRLKAAGYTEQKARTKRTRKADAERAAETQETQEVVHPDAEASAPDDK